MIGNDMPQYGEHCRPYDRGGLLTFPHRSAAPA